MNYPAKEKKEACVDVGLHGLGLMPHGISDADEILAVEVVSTIPCALCAE